jgi:hypothetical protein
LVSVAQKFNTGVSLTVGNPWQSSTTFYSIECTAVHD